MTQRLVVIGGDAAGMTAASRAKRLRGDALDVVVLEQGRFTSYSACGIPYWVGGEIGSVDDLVVRSPEEHRRNGIDVRLDSRATGIDLDRCEVAVDGSDPVGFDRLLIATGATPIRPPLLGLDAPNVHGVQTLTDGARLIDGLSDEPGRAVVIGAGYIGIEMAEALVRRRYDVTVVDRGAQPMSTLDADLGALVADAMEGLGIDVECDTAVESLDLDSAGRVTAVRAGGRSYAADLVVLGIGVRPAAEIAAAAGLPLGDRGGIRVNARMEVADGVYAAGDCVESWDRVARRWVHVPLGTHANKQGLVAGLRIAGEDAEFPGILKTAISKVCDLEVARTGLGSDEAAELGYDVVAATIETTTQAGYMPDTRPMTVKLLADRPTGRLLGAQIVGREGSAIRIDTCATALWAGLTVHEVMMSDLGYAPPFSSVWDPVQVAARKVVEQL
ncbi:MAG: FAD-dependent oxidoreductase [Nocardioidaceae bacterium]